MNIYISEIEWSCSMCAWSCMFVREDIEIRVHVHHDLLELDGHLGFCHAASVAHLLTSGILVP